VVDGSDRTACKASYDWNGYNSFGKSANIRLTTWEFTKSSTPRTWNSGSIFSQWQFGTGFVTVAAVNPRDRARHASTHK
jgi:hypothetical protein